MLALIVQTDSTTKATKDEKIKQIYSESTDAEGREFRSTLESIEQAERMRDNVKTGEQKQIYENLLEILIKFKMK